MAGKNLHKKPFDEGTLIKLKVYKEYFTKWLPVFVSKQKPIWDTIQIFDFFSGPGKDEDGEPGSPLIAIEIVKSLNDFMKNKSLTVILHFNEIDVDKYVKLVECVKLNEGNLIIKTYNKDFQGLFFEKYESMKNSANFLFFDQNGVKEITKDIFDKILNLKQTDFLLFISSSYFKRFATTPEFQKYFPFDPKEVAETDYYHIHRKVLQHYKALIPRGKRYFLAPFSIKKGANIYGLIFGSNHTLGIEKFLSVTWNNDKLRGDSNYDIDNEKINPQTPSLFDIYNKPNKRQVFENKLSCKILNNTLQTKYAVYLYTLNEGFLFKDANVILEKLKKEKKLDYTFKTILRDLHKESDNEKLTIL